MKLTAAEFDYDESVLPAQTIARIRNVFDQSDEVKVLQDQKHKTYNHLHRQCWIYQVHPIPVLTSMQREQSLLGNDGREASDIAWSHALGVVGQHTAGQSNQTWDGLENQITMCVRSIAWLGGIGVDEAFGNKKLWPSSKRWGCAEQRFRGGLMVDLLNLDGSLNRRQFCKTRESYILLRYTPRADKDMEEENGILAGQFVRPFYQ